ncbi:FAD-binding oxidoreductase [Ramlibacter sp. USB13]|uniref:FAD-binding oxidoreductase n=1 Tax=Ramlibacter cellulosilyticus TaxID=2764187 RepID=A0A923SDQ7_9BURK|nr:FAD-binding oxidoreductase [Ramlibacter cellulosilyticus]MBC5786296.1 FAD-binding oxidoreductase [Ramlibacter cellulosilyticus]
MTGEIRSWGLPGPFRHRLLAPASAREVSLPSDDCWVAHGNGRSYGDVGLNDGHTLVQTRWLDRYVDFDDEAGTLTCESGVLLATIVEDFLPRGWFLPVVPGTRHVTVGGAIANDVHGKNHHAMGSFGDHVEWLRLLRTDGTVLECSREENADWFAATVGGLGLTGLVTHARLRLRRVASAWMTVSAQRFVGLDAFFDLNAQAEAKHEYAVSWIDCLSGAEGLRGVLLAGDHASEGPRPGAPLFPPPPRRVGFPVTPPISLVNPLSLRLFNSAYFHRAPKQATFAQEAWGYFWPLDRIEHWNRIYGRHGLLQYQFVVPPAVARDAIREVLRLLQERGTGSFLAVLKTFGDRQAPGMLSFARPGLTLALDFPNTAKVRALFEDLDRRVAAAGGALYPAKDALGSRALFHAAYPRWAAFQRYRDPAVSSTFARRMEAAR